MSDLAPKYIAFIIFIWVTGSVLGAVLEQGQLTSGDESTLSQVMVWQQISAEEDWGILDIVSLVPEFFGSLFQMLTWQFSFLDSSDSGSMGPAADYLKWILLAPITGLAIFGIVIVLFGIFQKVL